MITTDCVNRTIISRVNITYYDPKYITTSIQNTIDHYNVIPYVDKYKNFNTQLIDDITVVDVNILYLMSQYPVTLTLIDTGSIDLLTSEFYLYQPTRVFSFTISSSELSEKDICNPQLHCFYATLNLPEEMTFAFTNGFYDPNIGNTSDT